MIHNRFTKSSNPATQNRPQNRTNHAVDNPQTTCENVCMKLTQLERKARRKEMYEAIQNGERTIDIAARFGVTTQTVQRAWNENCEPGEFRRRTNQGPMHPVLLAKRRLKGRPARVIARGISRQGRERLRMEVAQAARTQPIRVVAARYRVSVVTVYKALAEQEARWTENLTPNQKEAKLALLRWPSQITMRDIANQHKLTLRTLKAIRRQAKKDGMILPPRPN